MARVWPWVLATITCIGAGSVVAAIDVQVHEEPPSIIVGDQALGDQAVYTVYERLPGQDNWQQVDLLGFELVAIEPTPTAGGSLQPALKVAWADGAQHVFTGESSWAEQTSTWTYTDLGTRQLLSRQMVLLNTTGDTTLVTDFGPFLDDDVLSLVWGLGAPALRPETTWIAMAGVVVGPDEELDDVVAQRHLVELGLQRPGVVLGDVAVEHAGPAALDGKPVRGIRISADVEFALPDSVFPDAVSTPLASARPVGMLRGHVPATGAFSIARTLWYDAEVPYPMQVHDVLHGAKGRQEYKTELSLWRPGTQVVEWRPGAAPVAVERSDPAATYPQDGAAAGRFNLADAIEKAKASPEHLAFQAWEARHPGATLVHVTRQGTHWILGFGHPSGNLYFTVVNGGPPDYPWALNTVALEGPYSIEPFDRDRLPTGHITLAAAEGLWKALGGQGPSAKFVTWGTGALLHFPQQPYNDGMGLVYQSRLHVAGGPTESSSPLEGQSQTQALYMDSVSGRPLLFVHEQWATGVVAVLDTVLETLPEARPQPEAAVNTGGPKDLRADAGLLVTVTLLALLWTGYFGPALRFALGASLWPLYARLRRSEIESNPMREALVAAIHQDPGISPPELHRLVGGGWSTVVYHLQVLERNDLVRSVRDGRHRRFFPAALGADEMVPRVALRHERSRRAWALLRRNPGLDRRELARSLGVSVPAAMWHVERLRAAGLVGEDRLGRRHMYYGLDAPAAHREDPSIS